MNIVQRRKLIRELSLSIVTLIGKIDYSDREAEFTDVDLYVNDDVLASQFKYENPLKFNYNVVEKSEFATDLFKKYNFLTKPTFSKGFTLAEVASAICVFTICAASLITIATMLSTGSQDSVNRMNAFNAVENIAATMHNSNPEKTLSYISWGQSGVLYFDGSWNMVTTQEESASSARYESQRLPNSGTSTTYYTLDIKDFRLNGQNENLIEDIKISTVW